MLSLQDDYQLLDALGDELARRFRELGFYGPKSPLGSRNQSILAHGFSPVSKQVFAGMFRKTMEIVQVKEDELPVFPIMGSTHR